jgi:hypothetical protein
VWDIFGISAILQKNAEGHSPCGCGDCNQKLELSIGPGEQLNSNWMVHFLVPAARFWEKIGYT